MRIIVINLDEDTERRRRIENRLAELGFVARGCRQFTAAASVLPTKPWSIESHRPPGVCTSRPEKLAVG